MADRGARERCYQREFEIVTSEPISPELVLVDAELGARARAALSPPPSVPRAPRAATPQAPTAPEHHERRYPTWARVTASLWLLVIGILIGGAAIPHAQDKPRVIPKNDDAVVTVCKPDTSAPPVIRGHPGGT